MAGPALISGTQFGYGASNSGAWLRRNGAPSEYFPLEPKGILGGAYSGYNLQLSNRVVLGYEVDITAAGIKANETLLYNAGKVSPANFATAKLKFSGALRGRAGYAFDRILPYATAGVALGKYEVIPDYAALSPLPGEKAHFGWTVGAGVEYALTGKLTARIEYRYSDFGSKAYEIPGFPNFDTHVDLKTHEVRLGIALRF